MIHILLQVRCDDCSRPFGNPTVYVNTLFRSQIEEVRDAAHQKGWRRYRRKSTSSNGDYCPGCQKAHAIEKGKKL
jgi:hypothetical protein